MAGGTLSKHPPKRTRAEWYTDVKRMRDQGMSGLAIARDLGIGHSFVYGLLNDPDGSKDRERKRGYAGTCVDCGAETYGGEGFENAPERCAACHLEYMKASRYWTRERIIAAIQRFAREHGRPPTATDWQKAGRGYGYPPVSSVFRTKASPHNPFASWADAIEAAGFPRPGRGFYQRTGVAGLRENGMAVLVMARQRPVQGVTSQLVSRRLGVTRQYAGRILRSLVRRGLLEQDGDVPTGGGPMHVYKLSSDGASAPERTRP